MNGLELACVGKRKRRQFHFIVTSGLITRGAAEGSQLPERQLVSFSANSAAVLALTYDVTTIQNGAGLLKTATASTAKRLGQFLAKDFRQMFGPAYEETADRLGSFARSTIECLGRSDALYHNMEHTLLVTLVGRDILQGLALCHLIEPDDYTHLVCACLLHDIGYVRGILTGDTESEFVINQEQVKITLPRGASDAALARCHVDRSKIFALERLETSSLVDAKRVAQAIELTRFPAIADATIEAVGLEPKLVQAADLIGQLGDPLYPKKANALFYEFEEAGMNRQLGYSSPADLIDKYPTFFWNCISMHIEDGLNLLNLTASGRQWIANLHHHVLCAERSDRMMGPQLEEFTPDSHLMSDSRVHVPYVLSQARQSPKPAAIPG